MHNMWTLWIVSILFESTMPNNSCAFCWKVLRKNVWEVWRHCLRRSLSRRYYLQTRSNQSVCVCMCAVCWEVWFENVMFSFNLWNNFRKHLRKISPPYYTCNMSSLENSVASSTRNRLERKTTTNAFSWLFVCLCPIFTKNLHFSSEIELMSAKSYWKLSSHWISHKILVTFRSMPSHWIVYFFSLSWVYF